MPFVNPKLHMPVIKFIYWSIRQLDTGIQVKQVVLLQYVFLKTKFTEDINDFWFLTT